MDRDTGCGKDPVYADAGIRRGRSLSERRGKDQRCANCVRFFANGAVQCEEGPSVLAGSVESVAADAIDGSCGPTWFACDRCLKSRLVGGDSVQSLLNREFQIETAAEKRQQDGEHPHENWELWLSRDAVAARYASVVSAHGNLDPYHDQVASQEFEAVADASCDEASSVGACSGDADADDVEPVRRSGGGGGAR